jgi:hypothetical protein
LFVTFTCTTDTPCAPGICTESTGGVARAMLTTGGVCVTVKVVVVVGVIVDVEVVVNVGVIVEVHVKVVVTVDE